MADAIVSGFGTSSLVILAGATPLATHSVPSMTNSNGAVTAGAIADDTIDSTGTATSATLTQAGRVLTLSVGLTGSGAEVILSSLSYVAGGTSSITSLVITYPAS